MISSLPTGTTLFCHNPDPFFCKVIRAGLNSYWDHTATVVHYLNHPEYGTGTFIVEARGGEAIYPKCIYKWLREREDNTFHVSPARVAHARIESQYGKRYDY